MSSEPLKKPAEAELLYEADFFRWTQEQAEALRTRRLADLDWANLAEEIETVGRSDRSEIRSRLAVILLHLLKWRYQPGQRKGGWKASVFEQRVRIADLLEDSPSLHAYPAAVLAKEYRIARVKAADETGLPLERFAETCPFTLEEILDEAFLPEAAE